MIDNIISFYTETLNNITPEILNQIYIFSILVAIPSLLLYQRYEEIYTKCPDEKDAALAAKISITIFALLYITSISLIINDDLYEGVIFLSGSTVALPSFLFAFLSSERLTMNESLLVGYLPFIINYIIEIIILLIQDQIPSALHII